MLQGSSRNVGDVMESCVVISLLCICLFQVVIEADINTMSDDFKMIFRGRVGSSRFAPYFVALINICCLEIVKKYRLMSH